MKVRAQRVRVTGLEGGEERWGVLVEAGDGRGLLALSASSAEELGLQVDECGGVLPLARRRGLLPLDPVGLAPGEQGEEFWVEPGA